MSDLITSYERELLLLRRGLAEFGARHPRVAARLSMTGEHSEDMHVERMIQAAALLNARVRERLEDDVPDFTAPLLEVLYPEFLRPFPSCSIACFEPNAAVDRLQKPVVIKRGTHLTTRPGAYGFRTIYDVTLAPLRIDEAIYRLPSAVPSSVQLPQGASGVFSISFSVRPETFAFAGAAPAIARVFVDASGMATASLIDALIHRARTAFVEVDSSGRWSVLDAIPVSCAGFGEEEALIERPDAGKSQYRLLLEYFAYPQKFHFLDFHLGQIQNGRGAIRRLTLHVPVCGLHPDTAAATSLAGLTASNFRMGCTPVVNLFTCAAEPIALKDVTLPAWPLVPQTVSPAATAVWAVKSVRLTRDGGARDGGGSSSSREIKPFYSLEHHAGFGSSTTGRPALYWLAQREARSELQRRASECVLSFVDGRGEGTEPPRDEQIDAMLVCSNGDLPSSMQWGDPKGDFTYPDRSVVGKITLLHKPTDGAPRPLARNRYWNLIQSLSAGPFNLDQSGLPALKSLMEGHVPLGAPSGEQQISAIVGLTRETVSEWVVDKLQSRMVRGQRVRLAIDEGALGGSPLAVYARVLESVFVRYAPAHSFVQLVIVSANNGAELARGQLLPGVVPLV
ncbi:type VI secretion system baseplate subunit TssF [Paraburkholderia silviterrae]|uniref:Type VI secretion system baseplate subunit TssF n=1 Tax=Paraburkholderia silviterrae TaxID=2528715 RepID=A0A4R5MDQ6_9BURK|nr:type VI secretion system baseplate subunit TssF [Paraburkholderia silviterrae]TDG25222.1 type VI secretion system baseplate subunit TssF [Paraburkholderia silviterrae]